MTRTTAFLSFKKTITLGLVLIFAFSRIQGADTTNTAEMAANQSGNAVSNDALRAFLQLQEQIHATQLAIEHNREQAESAAVQNADALSNRLHAIEESLVAQRVSDLEAMQSTSHIMLIVLILFAIAGLMALLLTSYFQWRAVKRLSEISEVLPPRRAAGATSVPILTVEENRLVTAGQVEQTNSRLVGIIERLEKRVIELEHAATPSLPNGASDEEASVASSTAELCADTPARIRFLLDKGQSLLNADHAEEALSIFNDVLTVEPHHAEALVKKGAALERMRKPVEAIECYDRAIAADGSMTIAYLYKGGLCNRLERFGEAMECYEQALRTQEKRRAA